MRCGRNGLLGAAVGASLVTSEVFGVAAWVVSRVTLVGDELSPGLLEGVMSGIAGASGLSLVFLRW